MKKYRVTNNGDGSICVLGRTRIDIPAKCVDHEIVLPDASARKTISQLKQRYPILKFTEVKEVAQPQPEESTKQPQAQEKTETQPQAADTGKQAAATETVANAKKK